MVSAVRANAAGPSDHQRVDIDHADAGTDISNDGRILGVAVGEGRVEQGIARRRTQQEQTSQPDSLHLTQCNFVLCPIVEFIVRGLSGHLLGVLESSVVFR